MKSVFAAILALALASVPAAAVQTADLDKDLWPQFRGPTRDSRFYGPEWPESFAGERLRPTWRVDGLGPSYSGPVVTEDRVFITETVNESDEVVRALDRRSGRELWQTRWPGAMKMKAGNIRMGNWIKGTPTFDGESLFVAGIRDVLVCLDPESGAERWRVDFMERYGTPIPEYGFYASPLVVGDAVYVMASDSVVCVDKATGESRWRAVVRDELGHGSYATAEFGVIHGRPQILASTIPAMNGLDPATGEVLWRTVIDSQAMGLILPPFVHGDGVFTSSRGSQTGYYAIAESGGAFSVEKAWRNRVTAYYSYPILIDGHAYMHLQNGRMACIEMETGEETWISSERLGPYISTIVQGDRMLTLSGDGDLRMIRATPEKLDIVEERRIAEEPYTYAHLAMAGRELYVRERHALQVYEWR